MQQTSEQLAARLIAHRYLPRSDEVIRRVLFDLDFRVSLENNLKVCGLRLLDNPYASHVAVGLHQDAERAVMDDGQQWLSNNIGLPKDTLALTVVLWALIILPKRERQLGREAALESQGELFGTLVKAEPSEELSRGIPENVLLEDFGKLLGGKGRISNFALPQLSRLGLIERRNKIIYEGPLLDLVFDYAEMAPRIIQGALGDLIREQSQSAGAGQATS
ncbi:hypothetical protein [Methylophilus sp. DW102]|uniref:hypothetical protein n=1 Tax=Methylophilus sp. DW102 TaxID=3095607 RepID=UPI003090BED4|nr:hypothetical protein MTDW_18020 [Methylophilus sp. DW102]